MNKTTKTNTKPKKQVQVDLKNAETMKLNGNSIFIQGYVIKRISAIVSPTQEVISPVQVFNCGSCGELLPMGGELDELI